KLVRPDHRAGSLGDRGLREGGGRPGGRGLQKALGLGVGGQQLLEAGAELLIAATGLVEGPCALLGRGEGQRRPEQGFGTQVGFRHRSGPSPGAYLKKRKRRPARLNRREVFYSASGRLSRVRAQ